MADPRDPFLVLSLPYDADRDDVRRAFRRLARETHPDRGGAADAFHEVRDAYNALSGGLERERERWRPTPERVRIDPRIHPTCLVRVSRRRDGRRVVEYDTESRPRGWRPGNAAPPGGECRVRVDATGSTPAFGVWVAPLDAHRFRCVFGPHPSDVEG